MRKVSDSPTYDPPPSAALFRLTEDDVQEFQKLIHETTGLWMNEEEASRRANALLTLTRILIGPIDEDPQPSRVLTSSPLRYSAKSF